MINGPLVVAASHFELAYHFACCHPPDLLEAVETAENGANELPTSHAHNGGCHEKAK